jgi:hypothetical protein
MVSFITVLVASSSINAQTKIFLRNSIGLEEIGLFPFFKDAI